MPTTDGDFGEVLLCKGRTYQVLYVPCTRILVYSEDSGDKRRKGKRKEGKPGECGFSDAAWTGIGNRIVGVRGGLCSDLRCLTEYGNVLLVYLKSSLESGRVAGLVGKLVNLRCGAMQCTP